jgi:hypothetical protein
MRRYRTAYWHREPCRSPEQPLGSVAFDAQANERGERLIWLPPDTGGRANSVGMLLRVNFQDPFYNGIGS